MAMKATSGAHAATAARPSPKRARVDRGANRAEPPGQAALTRTEVYARFHEAEAAARAANERAAAAEDQLGRVVAQVQAKLGVHLERSAQLTATSGLVSFSSSRFASHNPRLTRDTHVLYAQQAALICQVSSSVT